MSYYQIAHFRNKDVVKSLLENNINNFVGDGHECHLNIPDDMLRYHLSRLSFKFDVMILERSGKEIIWIDDKNRQFIKDSDGRW